VDLSQESTVAIHTLPEIACVGWIEEALRRLDLPYGVGMARLETTLAGRLCGHGAGLVKLLFQREDRRRLGLQVIGTGAAELVHLGAAWIQAGTTIDQIADTVFDHPSLAEGLRYAALDALRAD
jgi:NAD(P) transhydrogenase